MAIRWLIFILLLSGISCAEAQTINAASCNASDVQTAFNTVTSSTTTVSIPACSSGVAWTTAVTLTVPSGNTNLTITGAGRINTVGGGDQTVIIDNSSSSSPLLEITTNATSTSVVRLAGITFEGGSGAIKDDGFIGFFGNSANIRFDHSHTNTAMYSPAESSSGIQFNGCTYGVVDHNIFDAVSGSVSNGVRAYNGGACFGDSLGIGDEIWANPTSFGSPTFSIWRTTHSTTVPRMTVYSVAGTCPG